ncbi:MAG: Sec-independent protein translocase protein TatB [Gammaproteobacteria bacterium]|nr:Sec-independent protein translocase protein TatB [Gammaproteobacteria bacterium]MDH5593473.1 Sec-independent protein translocase protein TatB [Gammaproteobacteria bacterium]MDH5613433.1 Sec-independent protein translocase protein TatB [Gammaproteobacteria bacterium]
MFDIGFWELAVIGIVALLVIGPDKLPSVARTTGLWIGRIRRMISNVKDDISKELKAEELKRIMEEQKSSNAIHEFIEETKSELSINNSEETKKPQDSGSTNDRR